MCNLDEAAHLICELARGTVQPQLAKLNSYFEDGRDLGVEKWLQVELAYSLRNAGYGIEVEGSYAGKKVDVVVSKPGSERKLVLELKAGNFSGNFRGGIERFIVADACKYTGQSNDEFIGCLFFGRFDLDELAIRERLEKAGCTLTCMQCVGEGGGSTKWWLGVARRHSEKAVALNEADTLRLCQQFESHIKIVSDELFDASMHFHLTNSLRVARSKYKNEFYLSHFFWEYTIKAHVGASISGLGRIYDRREDVISLRSLLEMIKASPTIFCREAFSKRIGDNVNHEGLVAHFGNPSWEQIERYIEFCHKDLTRCDDAVKILRKWRNKVFAHRDKDVSMDFETFNKQWPLKQEEVGKLISKGFEILDRCGGWYKATSYSRFPCSRGEMDYLYVMDAVAIPARRKRISTN